MDELHKLETIKNDLHGEIDQYGQNLALIKSKVEEAEMYLSNLERKIEEFEKNEIALNGKATQIRTEIFELEREKNALENHVHNHTALKSEIPEIEKKNKDLKDENERISSENMILSASHEVLSEKKAFHEKEIMDLQSHHSNLLVEHEEKKRDLHAEFENTKAELDVRIKSLCDQRDELVKEVKSLMDSIDTKHIILAEMDEKIAHLSSKLKEIDSEYATKRDVKEKELLDMQAKHDAREAAQNKRDGDLSLREGSIEIKHKALVTAKQRVEKEIGRSIAIDI